VNRRGFTALLGSALISRPAASLGQVHSAPLIGMLSPGSTAGFGPESMKAFFEGLHEQGYDEGLNVAIEYRQADADFRRLPALAKELMGLHPDVIVAWVTAASLAAKQATSTTPIVMGAVADPVGAGLVASLAHPGGNVSGTSGISDQLAGKAVELLRDAVPVSTVWR